MTGPENTRPNFSSGTNTTSGRRSSSRSSTSSTADVNDTTILPPTKTTNNIAITTTTAAPTTTTTVTTTATSVSSKPLLTLPNELLLQIAETLSEQRDLSSLLRTNHYLCNLLTPVLYSESICNSEEISLLHWAAARGQLGTLHHVLPRIRDIDRYCVSTIPHHETETALHLACFHSQRAAAAILLEHGANVHAPLARIAQPCWYRWSNQIGLSSFALHMAAREAKLSIIELLLEHPNTNINKQDTEGWTALHYAARGNQFRDCRAMVATSTHSIPPPTPDPTRAAVIRLLLNSAARPDLPGHTRKMLPTAAPSMYYADLPLFWATTSTFPSYVEPFLDSPQKLLYEQSYNKAFGYAVQHELHDVLALLWDRIPHNSLGVRSAVQTALWKGSAYSVRLMLTHALEHGHIQRTALHTAAERGHEDVLRILLDDAGLDEFEHWQNHPAGMTVLHCAAYGGNINIVRLLLQRGHYPAIRDAEQKLPMHKAAEEGHVAIVKLLESDLKSKEVPFKVPVPLGRFLVGLDQQKKDLEGDGGGGGGGGEDLEGENK